jgi:hypothetical protein
MAQGVEYLSSKLETQSSIPSTTYKNRNFKGATEMAHAYNPSYSGGRQEGTWFTSQPVSWAWCIARYHSYMVCLSRKLKSRPFLGKKCEILSKNR